MKIHSISQLDKKTQSILRLYSDIQTITTDSPLYYINHVPYVACLVVSGKLEISKNSYGKNKIVGEGSLIGIKELMNNEPSNATIKILQGTQLAFLDRSTINTIIKSRHKNLADFFQAILSPATNLI